MELKVIDPAGGTVMTPAPSTPDTASFAATQDRMRAEATGQATPEIPAPPSRPAADAQADKPKRTRRTKADEARTATSVERAQTAKTPDTTDYTAGAQSLVQNVWLGAALIPATQPYAYVLEANSDGLAAALAEGAKHNATIRGWCVSGGSMWQLQLAGVALSMGITCLQVARDPELREHARTATKAQLKTTLKSHGIEVPEPPPESADAAAS